jgi:hypothetical protein
MSLQSVIDKATYLNINKRKVTGTSISRSGQYKTSLRSPVPYSFTVGAPGGLKYSENRGLLEDLDSTDRITEANVNIGATNSGISYLTAYQGDANTTQLSALVLDSVSGANVLIDTTGATGHSGTLFKKGDYLQPLGNTSTYRYPYQVTSDVSFTSGTVTVPVHRPVLSQNGVALNTGGFRIGNDVRFHVKAFVMPTYTVVPYDLITFDTDFELIEVIE